MLFLLWPKGAKYLFVAPLLGVAMGGMMWGILAMTMGDLIRLPVFGLFLLAGVVMAEIMALFLD